MHAFHPWAEGILISKQTATNERCTVWSKIIAFLPTVDLNWLIFFFDDKRQLPNFGEDGKNSKHFSWHQQFFCLKCTHTVVIKKFLVYKLVNTQFAYLAFFFNIFMCPTSDISYVRQRNIHDGLKDRAMSI